VEVTFGACNSIFAGHQEFRINLEFEKVEILLKVKSNLWVIWLDPAIEEQTQRRLRRFIT